jgi:hypothetical protein
MKRVLLLIITIQLILAGCKKESTPPLSGTATIDNKLEGNDKTGYFAFGFSFSLAKEVSTVDNPPPDITIDNDGTIEKLILQTNNYKDSFYKYGEFADAMSAELAFNNMTSPLVPQWVPWANPVKPNQVWIFKTATEQYAKIRIISTISETRELRIYSECTFEWVYQPDGSLTFPAQ